jgi:hypothetical protein
MGQAPVRNRGRMCPHSRVREAAPDVTPSRCVGGRSPHGIREATHSGRLSVCPGPPSPDGEASAPPGRGSAGRGPAREAAIPSSRPSSHEEIPTGPETCARALAADRAALRRRVGAATDGAGPLSTSCPHRSRARGRRCVDLVDVGAASASTSARGGDDRAAGQHEDERGTAT